VAKKIDIKGQIVEWQSKAGQKIKFPDIKPHVFPHYHTQELLSA
jgi:hypothetical protein